MEDYHVAKFMQVEGHELGLFVIYDGHLGDTVPSYLQKHLFSNILKEEFVKTMKLALFMKKRVLERLVKIKKLALFMIFFFLEKLFVKF